MTDNEDRGSETREDLPVRRREGEDEEERKAAVEEEKKRRKEMLEKRKEEMKKPNRSMKPSVPLWSMDCLPLEDGEWE